MELVSYKCLPSKNKNAPNATPFIIFRCLVESLCQVKEFPSSLSLLRGFIINTF